MGKKAQGLANHMRQVGKQVNSLDRALGGAIMRNPWVGGVVTGANALVKGLDYFSELTGDLCGIAITHPGATGGLVAGVANGPVIRRRRAKVTGTRGIVRIIHKELVSSVNSSTGQQPYVNNGVLGTDGTSVFTVNAVAATTFPWLATIASNYDLYRFRRLRFVYVPLCPTSTSGRTTLVYDPDSSDPIPLDRVGLSNMSCSTEAPVWGAATLDVKLTDTNRWYYVSSEGSSATVGAYLNQGQVSWATYGVASAIQVGEVYAVYDVELKDPQPTQTTLRVAHGIGATVSQTFDVSAPVLARATATSIGLTFYTPGTYLVVARATATANSATTGTDITTIDVNGHNATTSQILFLAVRANATGAVVDWPGLTSLGTWDIFVTPSPPNTGSTILS